MSNYTAEDLRALANERDHTVYVHRISIRLALLAGADAMAARDAAVKALAKANERIAELEADNRNLSDIAQGRMECIAELGAELEAGKSNGGAFPEDQARRIAVLVLDAIQVNNEVNIMTLEFAMGILTDPLPGIPLYESGKSKGDDDETAKS